MYEILRNKMVQMEREREAADGPLVDENQRGEADNQLSIKIINRMPKILIAYTIPIVGIVFGVWYLHECPAQIKIPILEIAFFSLTLLDVNLKLPSIYRAAATGNENPNPNALLCLNFMVQLFTSGVFFAMCYYVYSTHPLTEPQYKSQPVYCDYLFYNVMFWGTTAFVTLICVSIPVWIISICCIAAYRA